MSKDDALKELIDMVGKRGVALRERLEFGKDAIRRIDKEIEDYKEGADYGKYPASDKMALAQFVKAQKSVASAMKRDKEELEGIENLLARVNEVKP